jgi:hypothetical protein
VLRPFTGARCGCRPGVERDNCPNCEGTGRVIDFAAIRARNTDPARPAYPWRYTALVVEPDEYRNLLHMLAHAWVFPGWALSLRGVWRDDVPLAALLPSLFVPS